VHAAMRYLGSAVPGGFREFRMLEVMELRLMSVFSGWSRIIIVIGAVRLGARRSSTSNVKARHEGTRQSLGRSDPQLSKRRTIAEENWGFPERYREI
jgi:hypothetical protein